MILNFSIKNKERNVIVVTGLTQESDQYIPEEQDFDRYYNFKYSETVTINIIQSNTSKESEYIKVYYNSHDILLDESLIELPEDGLYSITHMVLPTVSWLQRIIEKDETFLNEYNQIFVSDGNKIYQYINQELVEVPPELLIDINTSKTTISRGKSNTFSIWFLQSCYISICNQILQNRVLKCSTSINGDLLFKRDLIWMTINVIKYYISLKQMYEAQRILEQINYCNNICKEHNKSQGGIDCGCQ